MKWISLSVTRSIEDQLAEKELLEIINDAEEKAPYSGHIVLQVIISSKESRMNYVKIINKNRIRIDFGDIIRYTSEYKKQS